MLISGQNKSGHAAVSVVFLSSPNRTVDLYKNLGGESLTFLVMYRKMFIKIGSVGHSEPDNPQWALSLEMDQNDFACDHDEPLTSQHININI